MDEGKTMTPKEFAEEMARIKKDWEQDTEYRHLFMDDLMTSLLISLGYEEGVRIFDDATKWYT